MSLLRDGGCRYFTWCSAHFMFQNTNSSLSNTKDYAVKYGGRTNRCYMQSNCRKHAIKIPGSRTETVLKFNVLENAISWCHVKKARNGVRWGGGRCKIHGTSIYATRACTLVRREKRRRVERNGKKGRKGGRQEGRELRGKTRDCNNRVHVILNPVAVLSYCDGWYAVLCIGGAWHRSVLLGTEQRRKSAE